MRRGHSQTCLGAALAIGLVGLVPFPATPPGHRPPALCKNNSKLSCRVGEVLEVLGMKF